MTLHTSVIKKLYQDKKYEVNIKNPCKDRTNFFLKDEDDNTLVKILNNIYFHTEENKKKIELNNSKKN